MKPRPLVLLLALSLIALLGSGCQLARWLRLLSLKKQFAQVERYVRVEDQGGLNLHFLKPVVYADDLSLLIADETLRTTNGNRMDWLWTYEKQSAGTNPEPGNFDMSFTMRFEDLKFCELRFPERFLALMPKPLIIGLLRSVGKADVDVRHGTVKMKWEGPGQNEKVELPTKTQVLSLLGTPFSISESKGQRTYLYKYYQKMPRRCPPSEKLAWAKFTFAEQGDEITSSDGVIGNIGWSMVRVPGQSEPRVTFSLVPLSVEPVALKLPPQITEDFVGRYRATNGMVLSLGRDGDAFVVSWVEKESGGWCAAAPELTNAFFGIPQGLPRGIFLCDANGVVTGLVAQFWDKDVVFAKFADQLPPGPTVVPIEPKAYNACVGRYKGSWGGMVVIGRQGDQLYWQNEAVGTRIPLYPASETNFFFKAVDSPLTFVKTPQGEATKFILHFNGRDRDATKVRGTARKDASPSDDHGPPES